MCILYYFRRQDHTNKKYPEGIVTPENIAKEGEELGERISMLDCEDPNFPVKKTFGQRTCAPWLRESCEIGRRALCVAFLSARGHTALISWSPRLLLQELRARVLLVRGA